MTGYIVLGVFLATVVFGGGGFLLYFLKARKQWVWPDGTRVSVVLNEFTVHLVYDEEAKAAFTRNPTSTAFRCARAAEILALVAAEDLMYEDVPREFVVHVLGDTNYNKYYDTPNRSKSNGMTVTLNRKMGGETLPLFACRSKGFEHTDSSAELVIHELIHQTIENSGVGSGDPGHTNLKYWGYPNGLEGRATTQFQKQYGNG